MKNYINEETRIVAEHINENTERKAEFVHAANGLHLDATLLGNYMLNAFVQDIPKDVSELHRQILESGFYLVDWVDLASNYIAEAETLGG